MLTFGFYSQVKSTAVIIPDMASASSDPAVALLKSRIDAAKPLGLVRADSGEILIVYDSVSRLCLWYPSG